LPNIRIKSRRISQAKNGEKRNAYRLLVANFEGKGPLGRLTHREVDNVKMDLGEIGWVCMDWIGLARDRDEQRAHGKAVMNLRVP
jgi:hypothetical protein